MMIYYCKILLMTVFVSVNLFAEQQAKVVETLVVTPKTLTSKVKLIGTIKAGKESRIYAEGNGVLSKIYVAEGSPVKKGALLAQLENSNEKQALELATSSVFLSKKQFERTKKLFAAKDISEFEFDEAKKDLVTKEIAQGAAQKAYDKTRFIAPFNGVCGVFSVSEGAFVKSAQHIVDFYDSSSLKVEFAIPESLLKNVKMGHEVSVKGNRGLVNALQATMSKDSPMGQARAALGSCSSCFIGQTVEVEFVADERIAALSLPKEAIFFENGQSHVYVVKDKKAILTKINTGMNAGTEVEVVSGLTSGASVVLRGQQRLSHDALVEIAS